MKRWICYIFSFYFEKFLDSTIAGTVQWFKSLVFPTTQKLFLYVKYWTPYSTSKFDYLFFDTPCICMTAVKVSMVNCWSQHFQRGRKKLCRHCITRFLAPFLKRWPVQAYINKICLQVKIPVLKILPWCNCKFEFLML